MQISARIRVKMWRLRKQGLSEVDIQKQLLDDGDLVIKGRDKSPMIIEDTERNVTLPLPLPIVTSPPPSLGTKLNEDLIERALVRRLNSPDVSAGDIGQAISFMKQKKAFTVPEDTETDVGTDALLTELMRNGTAPKTA